MLRQIFGHRGYRRHWVVLFVGKMALRFSDDCRVMVKNQVGRSVRLVKFCDSGSQQVFGLDVD